MIKTCAILSNLAYQDKLEFRNYKHKFITDSETDTQVHVLSSKYTVIVVFRGTESAQDAKQDLKSAKSDNVHVGFSQCLLSVRAELMIALYAAKFQNKKVYFTGHSLGGSLAILAAAVLPVKPYRIITFGAPMVGNEAFKELYKYHDITYRYENKLDPIPRLPSDKLGYIPVGSLCWISLRGKILHKKPWWAEYLALWWGSHKITNYISSIEEL